MIMDNRFLVARRRYDPDATRYINAVQLADGQALEPEVAMAVDGFVRGCKADGIWDAIKASCILCGARTLSGALVPLKGAAPTPNGFVSGDYTRGGATPGLQGDGSTTYLDSNRAGDSEPQNNFHVAVKLDGFTASTGVVIGHGGTGNGRCFLSIANSFTQLFVSNRSATNSGALSISPTGSPFYGTTRNTAGSFSSRGSSTDFNSSIASETPNAQSILVFARSGTASDAAESFSNARICFYSIGEAIDLEALDTAVTNLITAIGNAL